MFGTERFNQLLHDLANQSAVAITSQILHAVEMFRCSAPTEDDLTLIILKEK